MTTSPVIRVVEREARVYVRLWRGLAFSIFVQPALYLAAMGLGLGGLIDENAGHVAGLDYLAFVAPGLLVASTMQLSVGEGLWPILAGVKWIKFFHGVVATPIRPAELYGGYVSWVALRSVFGSSAFLLIALVLGALLSPWAILAIPIAALCAAAFCAPVAAFAMTQDSDLAFPMIMRLGVLPLFLFSGTFFPISELPSGVRPFAGLSPLWHAVELARHATTGRFDALPDLGHVLVLAACVAVGAGWGVRTFTRRLTA
jgi:lipooligosaccharide transport system permease protein